MAGVRQREWGEGTWPGWEGRVKMVTGHRTWGSSSLSHPVAGHGTQLATCTVNPEHPEEAHSHAGSRVETGLRANAATAAQTAGRKLGYVKAGSPGLACYQAARVTGPPGPRGPGVAGDAK